MRPKFLLALVATVLAVLPGNALALTTFLDSDDDSIGFDSGTGVLSTSLGIDTDDAVVVFTGQLPNAFFGSTLHMEMQIAGAESIISMGTPFVGTGGNDIWITDSSSNLLLTAQIINVSVTGGTVSIAPFAPVTSLTIGGFDPAQSDFLVTGGSEADVFGGVGEHGTLALLLEFNLSKNFGSVFSSDFEVAGRAQLSPVIVPEPSTFLMLSGALAALAVRREAKH